MTIDEVAERAGYSRMPIYSLFGDKQNLYFELWKGATGEMMKLLLGSMPPGQPLRRCLRQIAEIIAAHSADERPRHADSLFFVVQTIALSRPDIGAKLRELSQRIVEDFAAFVGRCTLAKGEALRGDPRTVAGHLIAHINGLATVQFQTGGNYTRAADLIAIFETIAFKSKA